MSEEGLELNEKNELICDYTTRSFASEVNNHQTTDLLSSGSSSIERFNREISEDCSIRYHHTAVAQVAVGPWRRAHYRRLRTNMTSQAPSHRRCSFIIGVVYSVVALAAAAASLGYRYDVANDSYGFRVLLEGTGLLATVTFLASLGLVYGVIESRKSFVAAWIVLQVVVPLYTVVFYGWAIYVSGNKDDFGPVRTAVPYVAMVAAVHISVMIGCTIIVNKFYQYLKIRDSVIQKYGMESS